MAGITREASRIVQLLVKLCDKCGGKNHFKNVCKSAKSGSSRRSESDGDRSCRTKGKCTHRCDIHEIDCCDDSPENSTESTDMDDLADQVPESILSLRYLVDQGISKTYTGTN